MYPDLKQFRIHCGALLAAGCVLTAMPAFSAEYRVAPSIKGRMSYDSNLLLNPDGREIKTFMYELTPGINARMSTGKWQAIVDANLTAIRLEDEDFDSDNQNLTLQLARSTETTLFQLRALNDRQSTRSVELEQLGEVGFEVERRDRQSFQPLLSWTLNPTNRLVFSGAAENVHYGGLNFSDYDYYSANVGWTHQFDEKTQFSVTTFGSRYSSGPPEPRLTESEDCPFFPLIVPGVGIDFIQLGVQEKFESDTLGLQVGASRQPSRRFSYRSSIGYRNVDSANSGRCSAGVDQTFNDSGESDGFVLDTGLNYQGEKYGLDLSLSRSVSPVGLGFLTERDDFNLNVSYRYSEQITLELLINGFRTESIDDSFEFERDGLRVTPRMNWRLTEKLRLSGGLRYRNASFQSSDSKRDGLAAFVGFDYLFKPTTFSR